MRLTLTANDRKKLYHPDSYDYYLPMCDIAQHPKEKRDESRLLVLKTDKTPGDPRGMHHRKFKDIPDYLCENDCLILNRTRVIPARILGFKYPTGGSSEIFLLESVGKNRWKALMRPSRRLREDTQLIVPRADEHEAYEEMPADKRPLDRIKDPLWAQIDKDLGDGMFVVSFLNADKMQMLEPYGSVPLPPYIHTSLQDPERYQTIYAQDAGSVAAPTAGLHFTDELMQQLKEKGVNICYLTLHIGLDTFRPVRGEDIRNHQMHREYLEVSDDTVRTIEETKAAGAKAVAVGTTVVRALESAAAQSSGLDSFSGETDLFIYPGYRFSVVDALITNFHLPKSTLMMLVSALGGRDRIMAAYREARRRGYRFYSFGDAMFII